MLLQRVREAASRAKNKSSNGPLRVQSKVRFPQIAQENNISGRVLLMFVIERDGSLTNIQVLQTPDSSLSDEAIRVLKTSPKWTPGRQRNQSVRVKYTLPIDFRIQQ